MQYSNSQKGIAPIIIVLILAIILAGAGDAYYFKQQQSKSSSVLDETADWKTYQNTKYGFEFKYPKEYVFSSSEAGGAFSPGYIPICSRDTLACVSYPSTKFTNSNFEGAAFAIDINPDIKIGTETNCAIYDGKITKINGTTFSYSDKGMEAALGNIQEHYVYKTLHDQVCFQVSLGVDYMNEGTYRDNLRNGRVISEIDKEKVFDSLRDILSTFKFTQ